MHAPTISVAVVTRNRPQSLERSLRSLRAQGHQPFEVLVSDDSDYELAAASRGVAESYECLYVRGPRRGLYANRNAAALKCSGSHIRSMDDDHEFPADHWVRCEQAVAADPTSVWIIPEFVPSMGWLSPGELHPRGYLVAPRDPDHTWAIADGASIYPADIFRGGLRFSEAFRFGCSFKEFGSRLHRLGYRIRLLRTTHVVHHADPADRSFDDPEEELGARCFAALCHSFAYQPSILNKLLTTAEIARHVATTRGTGVRAFRRGYSAYRDQRKTLRAWIDSGSNASG
jgi:glycosyltransferase involved in cell wall biosynthesis